MTIGVLHIEFRIHGARSLKDKRRVIKSIKSRMRNRYNCSVAETHYHDLWDRSSLTVCVVSNESRHADKQLNEISRFAMNNRDAEVIDYRIELL